MFAWLAANTATIIVVLVILVLIGLAVYSLVRDKKKGSGVCTGNCASCGAGCPHGEGTLRK